MVSLRCKMVVKSILDKYELHYSSLDLGEVTIIEDIDEIVKQSIKTDLLKCGLLLMDDKKSLLIEKIKINIVEMVHYSEDKPKTNFSTYLAKQLNYDYNYLSNLFSVATGTTIEQYIISHKIERVKELLLYDELSLAEIAFKLNYSSAAHLSKQFKKVTGLTPIFFKKLKQHKLRVTLESI